MEKISRISNELKDWIINTLHNGAAPESIVDSMITKGFDPRFAYTTLFRIIGNKSVKTIDDNQQPYMYEQYEIGRKGNYIHTHDREIKVLMRIEKPFILYLDNVLSMDECDALIRMSKNRLQPSQVIDRNSGEEQTVSGRTSEGTHFKLKENVLISNLEKRMAELTHYPINYGEGLQVLHYQVGDEYKPHFDFLPSSKIDPNKGGQRICTLLLYLNDVPAGGETIFPKIGLSITPKKGTALYFHYGNSMGQVNRMSLHSSIPVLEGEKWVATKWIRQGPIGNQTQI